MMNGKKYITITDANGEKTDYHVLCSFDSPKMHKTYIIYTDFSKTSTNDLHVYYGYFEQGNHSQLKPVETPEEISLLDDVVSCIEQELNP